MKSSDDNYKPIKKIQLKNNNMDLVTLNKIVNYGKSKNKLKTEESNNTVSKLKHMIDADQSKKDD